MTLQITAIDHVGIAVPDLDAAIDFHTGVLGGVLAHRETNAEQGVEEAMIAFGDGAQVQLLAPLSAESTIAKFLDRNGPGLQQLAYRVPDVRAAAELRQGGRDPDPVRRAAPRHGRVVDQLPAPQGRRRRAGRTASNRSGNRPKTRRAQKSALRPRESAAAGGTMTA